MLLSEPGGYLAALVVQAVAWLALLLVCLLRVRRPWAWPGLAGSLLGGTAAALSVLDELQTRAATESGDGWFAYAPGDAGPSFLLAHDLYGEVLWAQTLGLALVAAAGVTAAVAARRRTTSDPAP